MNRRAFITFFLAAVSSGCTSAVQSGYSTALDSIDLVQMTDQMAASIASSPQVQQAIHQEGALRIVVQPVDNQMTGEVLPRGEAEAFTARVRALLSQHDPTEFVWIMNRDTFYRLRDRELEQHTGVPLGPSPDAINPRYALWAHFHSLTKENSKGRSSAYLCVFELTDLDHRNQLWQDSYQVKKSAAKGFLD